MLGGGLIFWESFHEPVFALIGGSTGLVLAISIIFIEHKITKSSFKAVLGGVVGLIMGLISANLFSLGLLFYFPERSLAHFTELLIDQLVTGIFRFGNRGPERRGVCPC